MKDFLKMVQGLFHTIESYHDSYTEKHEEMTAKIMFLFGKELGLGNESCHELRMLGNIHDIGKIAIPSKILEKPGSLNSFERSVVQLHPKIGAQFIEKIEHPLKERASQIILNHHESFDGSGYPNGIKGDAIPFEARICSICDVYDALRAHRPYREKKLGHEMAMEKILDNGENGLRKHFDPELLAIFENISDKIFNLYNGDGDTIFNF